MDDILSLSTRGRTCAPCDTMSGGEDDAMVLRRIPGVSLITPLDGTGIVVASSLDNEVELPGSAFLSYLMHAVALGIPDLEPAYGTKGAGNLVLTLQLPAAVDPAVDRGARYLVPAHLFSIISNKDAKLPSTTVSFSGILADGTSYSHTVSLRQRCYGTSTFLVLIATAIEKRVFPAYAMLERDYIYTAPGTSIPLTAGAPPNDASAAQPTNGLRGDNNTLVATVTAGAEATDYEFAPLSPMRAGFHHVFSVAATAHLTQLGG